MIPKLHAVCPKCTSATKVVMSNTFAEGQHRRHVCRECEFTFYTLTPYDGGTARMQGLPFKDRPLTELEAFKRAEMIVAADKVYVTPEVTFDVECITALTTTPSMRSARQRAIASAVGMIEKLVNSKYPKEGTHD